MRRLYLVSIALVLLVAACGGSIPHATDAQLQRAQQRWPGTTRAALDRGRDVYVTSCSGCHNLYRPAKLTSAKLPSILKTMAPRAKLAPPDAELVLRYLVAVAGR